MKINCHSHIFSLSNHFGKETVEIVIDRVLHELGAHKTGQPNLMGFFESLDNMRGFTSIGFLPAKKIAEKLIRLGGREDVYVALPLDFNQSMRQLTEQLRDLVEAAYCYPGRILPFAAFHGDRNNAAKIATGSLESGAFVGVKMYPSMGFPVNHKSCWPLFAHCSENSVPIITHCSPTGFNKSSCGKYASPARWRVLLSRYQNLKVCFAHFGGEHELIKKRGWADIIVELMNAYPGQVYADISCHTHPMLWKKVAPKKYRRYFQKLGVLLTDPVCRQHVLWGTDFYMNSQHTTETKYKAFFERELFADKQLQKELTLDNPRRFLGILDSRQLENNLPNIIRHVEFLQFNRTQLNLRQKARWIRDFLV